jgi:hypothetical protein
MAELPDAREIQTITVGIALFTILEIEAVIIKDLLKVWLNSCVR